MIVKIQLPLTTKKGEELMALVYNKGHSIQTQIPVTDALIKAMGGEVKAYFLIQKPRREGQPIKLVKRVERNW